jgi:SnoaL-like protein
LDLDQQDVTATRSACGQLLAEYLLALDGRDWAALESIFAESAIFKRTGTEALRGGLQIRRFFEALEQKRSAAGELHLTRHLLTTVSIEAADMRSASSTAYVLVFRDQMRQGDRRAFAAVKPELLLEYRDRFVKHNNDWQIGVHEAHHIFRAAEFRPPFTEDEQHRVLQAVRVK